LNITASEMNSLWSAENVYPFSEQEKHSALPSQTRLRTMAHMQEVCNDSTHYYFSSTCRHQSELGPWGSIH